jgi:DNA-binding Xre family transcriptional regulator
MKTIVTKGRITALLGRWQMETREHVSLRRLADLAQVPRDFVYRLDAGEARYIELDAVARLCNVLQCHPEDLLVLNSGSGPGNSIQDTDAP